MKRKLRWAGGREWVQDRHNLYSLCSDQVIELGRGFGASKEMLAKLRMLGESLGAIEHSPIGYRRQTKNTGSLS